MFVAVSVEQKRHHGTMIIDLNFESVTTSALRLTWTRL